jgi:hypothetical protein
VNVLKCILVQKVGFLKHKYFYFYSLTTEMCGKELGVGEIAH